MGKKTKEKTNKLPKGVRRRTNEAGEVEYGIDIYTYEPATGKRSKRLRPWGFASISEAEEVVAAYKLSDRAARHGLIVESPPTVNLSELADAYVKGLAGKDVIRHARRVLKYWIALLPSGITVDQITAPDVRKFITSRSGEVSASTVDREVKYLGAALHRAPELFKELQTWSPPRIPHPKYKKNRREVVITDEIYSRLIEWLCAPRRTSERLSYFKSRQRAGRLFQFMMLTGARTGEAAALKKTDIEWHLQRLRIYGAKTDATRYVPLSEPCAQVLRDQIAEQNKGAYVFLRGGVMSARIYDRFRDACEALEIEYGRDAFELYAARHTFTTHLLNAGHDLKTVGSVTGHADATMTMHYSHVLPGAHSAIAATITGLESKRRGAKNHSLEVDTSENPLSQTVENKA